MTISSTAVGLHRVVFDVDGGYNRAGGTTHVEVVAEGADGRLAEIVAAIIAITAAFVLWRRGGRAR